MPDQRAGKPRCEFTRWDARDGHMVYVCHRIPEAVEMHDGGYVYVCSYHRPWTVAMGTSREGQSGPTLSDQPQPVSPTDVGPEGTR